MLKRFHTFENHPKAVNFLDLLDAYHRDVEDLFPIELVLHFQKIEEDNYTFECTVGNFELGEKDPNLPEFRRTIYEMLGGNSYYNNKQHNYINFTAVQYNKMIDLAKKKRLHIVEDAQWRRIYVKCDDIEDLIYQVEALLINIKKS